MTDQPTTAEIEAIRERWKQLPDNPGKLSAVGTAVLASYAVEDIPTLFWALDQAQRKPGDLLGKPPCPICGSDLEIMVGDEEGEVSVIGDCTDRVKDEVGWYERYTEAQARIAELENLALEADRNTLKVHDRLVASERRVRDVGDKIDGLAAVRRDAIANHKLSETNRPESYYDGYLAGVSDLNTDIREYLGRAAHGGTE